MSPTPPPPPPPPPPLLNSTYFCCWTTEACIKLLSAGQNLNARCKIHLNARCKMHYRDAELVGAKTFEIHLLQIKLLSAA